RLKILDGILNENNRAFNESCVGKIFECLVEGPDKTGKHLIARTPYMQQIIIPKTDSALVPVRVTSANKCSLRGEVVKNQS
ncbi:MAG: TRAM domain-containing protein, partial [Alphaproteobacteria bacterium]|nr:TRAM domain-containing protein [Alphaproteobacteria bacterium]